MSFGLVTTFGDPDRYQATVRGGDCEVLLNDGGDFKVELTRIDFEFLWMQRGRSFTRSHITHVGLDPKRAVVL